MRGKAKHHHKKHDPKRITPAYAGKSRYARRGFRFGGDHPRLCGEKGLNTRKWTIALGSPPPMRGKVLRGPMTRRMTGITPAYAGKSRTAMCWQVICRDHPRLCGEKQRRQKSGSGSAGSPPPMRGKDNMTGRNVQRYRITPAYAGKSHSSGFRYAGIWDHPRLCGEKSTAILACCIRKGSPPPMRGKADRTRNKEGRNRITPAYAGKSGIITVEVSYMQDHPRLCGEKWQMSPSAPSKTGSPPPMRGKAEQQVSGENHGRITPAYAGKSRTGNSWTRRHRDHPRLCGEKCPTCPQSLHGRGSPPPMRGKVPFIFPVVGVVRITPAYAGKRSRCTGFL